MAFKLHFLGAVQNVTGSRHMLEANGTQILVDCGLYQERQFADRNWDKFPTDPGKIDALLLTHAHLDHCGLIPKLVREGFRGKIYCTDATAQIAEIILFDSAHIQEEDAAYKQKRHKKAGKTSPHGYKPLYTKEDVENCLQYFQPVPYREVVHLGDGVEATFYDAGHVLGSAIIRAKIRQDGEERIVIFSGDMGRPDRPIVCDPTVFDEADYVLIESTYGDRVHEDQIDIKEQIANVINKAFKTGGKIIVPSFALERSQELLYYINELLIEEKIPPLKVYLDSPMANKITTVFKKHPELYDTETTEYMNNHESPFDFPGFEMTQSTAESKALNEKSGTCMIIAGSGMCTGGRVKHHLVNNVGSSKNIVMFVGYQAVGTLGRSIVNGDKKVRILGQKRDIKAKIVRINGFSAHADRDELLDWLKSLKKAPKKVFVVHGEENSAKSFGEYVYQQTGWDVLVPEYQQQVTVD
jgi:metallo-beta-lactamase family protein